MPKKSFNLSLIDFGVVTRSLRKRNIWIAVGLVVGCTAGKFAHSEDIERDTWMQFRGSESGIAALAHPPVNLDAPEV